MIFGKTTLELRVGIFVFFGTIILAIFVLLIGNFKMWGASHRVNFLFNFVNGVKVGAPVRFAGVDVGEVKSIDFVFSKEEDKMKVEIKAIVKKEAGIPRDSKVWVNTLGLLGEKYLEIMPGKDYSNYISDNQDIIGNDPVAMHEVGELAKSIADNMNSLITKLQNKDGSLGKMLYDDEMYKALMTIFKDTDKLVLDTQEVAQDIKQNPWKLFWKSKEKPVRK
ncbi:MAG: MlaD family protein [Candidatus Omnitrophica bacterium]|nr:MlaD family protein [Candidatus Omnitrophota bacterium]